MDEGSISGSSVRGLALTTASTTKDTHDNVDSTSGGNSTNNNNARYVGGALSDCQNVSSSGGAGCTDLSTSAVVTHIKQSPTSPSPMSSSAADSTPVGLHQQHHHRQSDEVHFGGTASNALVSHHAHTTTAAPEMHHQQSTHAQHQQHHNQHQQQQQHHQHQLHQQQQQHLQRLGSSLSSISASAAHVSASVAGDISAAEAVTSSRLGLSERPPPPPYSNSASVMASKSFHSSSSCVANSTGDTTLIAAPSSARLSAYEQFLKLSAHEYAASSAADNGAVLNLSGIGKSSTAAESDLMLRHVNVAAAMAAAAVGNIGGVVESSGVGVSDGCERN